MSRTRTRDTRYYGYNSAKRVKVNNLSTSAITVHGVNIPAGGETIITLPHQIVIFGGVVECYTIDGRKETITDVSGNVRNYNPVVHTKELFSYPKDGGASQVLELAKGSQRYRVTFLPGGDCASLANLNAINAGSYPAFASQSELLAQAIGKMKPGVPPVEADILQFIGELTDFRGLLVGLARRALKAQEEIVKFLRGSYQHLKWQDAVTGDVDALIGLVRKYSSRSLKDWAVAGAEVHLAMKLVYEPLMRDVKKIYRAIHRLNRSYIALSNPKPFRVRASASAGANALFPVVQTASGLGVRVESMRRRTLEVRTWAMVVNNKVDLPKANFIYHYLGLNPRISVAWELIPLSFVVDMFIDFGRYLRQFESAPIQLGFTTIASGYSVKSTTMHHDQLYWDLGPDLCGSARVPGNTGSYSSTDYRRLGGGISFDAGTIEPIQIKLPSFGQLWTIAELILVAFGRK